MPVFIPFRNNRQSWYRPPPFHCLFLHLSSPCLKTIRKKNSKMKNILSHSSFFFWTIFLRKWRFDIKNFPIKQFNFEIIVYFLILAFLFKYLQFVWVHIPFKIVFRHQLLCYVCHYPDVNVKWRHFQIRWYNFAFFFQVGLWQKNNWL